MFIQKNNKVTQKRSIVKSLFDMEVPNSSKAVKRLETSKFRSPSAMSTMIRKICAEVSDSKTLRLPFIMAVQHLSTSVCQFLLESGANVDSAYEDGESALHNAVALESLPKCALLSSHAAKYDAKWEELTPVDWAMLYTNKTSEILKSLNVDLTTAAESATYVIKILFS